LRQKIRGNARGVKIGSGYTKIKTDAIVSIRASAHCHVPRRGGSREEVMPPSDHTDGHDQRLWPERTLSKY